MKKTNPWFSFLRPSGTQGRPRDDRVHPATDSSNASPRNDHLWTENEVAKQPTPSVAPHRVAARSVLEPPSTRSGRPQETDTPAIPAASSSESDGSSSRKGKHSAKTKSSCSTENVDKQKSVITEQPKSSKSSNWLAARKVASSSKSTKWDAWKRQADDSTRLKNESPANKVPEAEESLPASSSFAENPCKKAGNAKGSDLDEIKVKRRRLAQRQRRLNPRQPLHPQHQQHPFIQIDIEGQSIGSKKRGWLCRGMRSCMRGFMSKCLITGEDIRSCVCEKWTAFFRKKAEWDRWNPDRNHPFVKWINESKLAGLKETVKPNRGILYRIYWLIIFLLLFGGGMKFSIDTFHFHRNSPILFGYKTKEIPIEKIPFPTVTVCPFNSYRPTTISNAKSLFNDAVNSDHDNNITNHESWNADEAATLVYYMDHVCGSNSAVTNIFKHDYMKYQGPFHKLRYKSKLAKPVVDGHDDKLNEKLTHYLRNVSLKCEDVFRFCVWNLEKSGECENYFRSLLTNHGGCCSFNNLPLEKLHKKNPSLRSAWEKNNPQPWKFGDWDKWSSGSYVIEDDDEGKETFPARQKFGGRPWGLTFIHKMEDNGDCAQFDSSGSRITISVPGTDFDVAKLNVAIPPRSEVFIELTPELTTADEELRTIPPERRGCYFPDEKPLAYYNNYSQENCYRECFANFTLSQCSCTLLSFPNSAGELLCDGQSTKCARNVERKLFESGQQHRCSDCLPSCNQMTLRKEITSTPLSQEYKSNSPFSTNDSSSIVHLFYGPSSVIVKERQLRHSKYELMTQIGSIFETTNDISLLGMWRTLSSLYVFYPTLWELLKLFLVYLLMGLKKYLSCLTLCFGNRQRIAVLNNAPVPPVRFVNVIEDELLPNPPNVNYNIFLALPYVPE